MSALLLVHAALGYALVPALVLLFLWALPSLSRTPSPRFFRALRGVAWGAILQVATGFILFLLAGLRPLPLHLLYGILSATVLHFLGGLEPGGWFYAGLKHPPRQVGPWIFAGLLFALGLSVRAVTTALAG
ncbi:hypothetical protein [Marinithermus hydrothermalis]|nr:hypothetical protein [Marinithermus hydrothermalis]